MNVAITTKGDNLDSQVSDTFESCSFLLIVNMEDLSVTAVSKEKLSETPWEENLTRQILEYDCEAVITGNINQRAFDILADAYVTRYFGVSYSAKDALELSEKQMLKLIKEDCHNHH